MRVRALRSFAGLDADGKPHRYSAGDEFDLPPGVDWLDVGLVEPARKSRKVSSARASKRKSSKVQ